MRGFRVVHGGVNGILSASNLARCASTLRDLRILHSASGQSTSCPLETWRITTKYYGRALERRTTRAPCAWHWPNPPLPLLLPLQRCVSMREVFDASWLQPSLRCTDLSLAQELRTFTSSRGPLRGGATRKRPQATARGGVARKRVAEEAESGAEATAEPKKGKNQRKREAKHGRNVGIELLNFTKKEIDTVVRLAGLDEEVAEAVALAKTMAKDEGRRRQFNYIGGMLRDIDPFLLETAMKAAKDGNLGGYAPPPALGLSPESEEGSDSEGEEEDGSSSSEEDFEESERVTRWIDGLLRSDTVAHAEVYSRLEYTGLDRQELRRLIRAAHRGGASSGSPRPAGKEEEKLAAGVGREEKADEGKKNSEESEGAGHLSGPARVTARTESRGALSRFLSRLERESQAYDNLS